VEKGEVMENTKIKLLKLKEKIMEEKNVNYFAKHFEIVVLKLPKSESNKDDRVYYFYFDKKPIFFSENISDFLCDIKVDEKIKVDDLDKLASREKKLTFDDIVNYQFFLSKCIKFGSFVGIVDLNNKSFRKGIHKLFTSIKSTEKTNRLKEKIMKMEKEIAIEEENEKE
jgi:hypothetical protein